MNELTTVQKRRQIHLLESKTTSALHRYCNQLISLAPKARRIKLVPAGWSKEALSLRAIELEYGLVGSMPANPHKVKASKLLGKVIRIGYIDDKPATGLVTSAEKNDFGSVDIKFFDFESKETRSVDSLEQIIDCGDIDVSVNWANGDTVLINSGQYVGK